MKKFYALFAHPTLPLVTLTVSGVTALDRAAANEATRQAAASFVSYYGSRLLPVPASYVVSEGQTDEEREEVRVLVATLYEIDPALGEWALSHAIKGERAPGIKLMLRHVFEASGRDAPARSEYARDAIDAG